MKKNIIYSTSLLLGLVLLLFYIKPFAKTEFILLNHMTEFHDDKIEQICLIKNPPYKSSDLYKLIVEYSGKDQTQKKPINTAYIKEHNYSFLFGNIDYLSKETPRDEIDNIDLLAESKISTDLNGKRLISIHVYKGEIWFYKK